MLYHLQGTTDFLAQESSKCCFFLYFSNILVRKNRIYIKKMKMQNGWGMFRPFHAFVSHALRPNEKSQSKSYFVIDENYLWGSIDLFFSLMTSCIWTRAEKSRLCGFGRFHSGCCLFWNILGKFPHSVVYQTWRKRCQNKLLNHDLIYFAKVFLKSSKISVWNKPLKVRQEVNWIPFLGDCNFKSKLIFRE